MLNGCQSHKPQGNKAKEAVLERSELENRGPKCEFQRMTYFAVFEAIKQVSLTQNRKVSSAFLS